MLGTDNVDCQLGDGLPAEVVLGLPRATIDEACAGAVVILLAPDLKEELPVLYLRLRGAAVGARQLRLVELRPAAPASRRYATDVARLPARRGRAAPWRELLGRRSHRRSAPNAGRACSAGRRWPSRPASSSTPPAARSPGVPGVALPLGAAAGQRARRPRHGPRARACSPAGCRLDDGRAWFSDGWGTCPPSAGLDTAGDPRGRGRRRLQVLVLLGADPLGDFPDRELARAGPRRGRFVIAVDAFLTDSARQADVVLAAATFAERPGTTTNLEGRVTRLGQKITPPEVAWPDWMIAVELAFRLGDDLGFVSLEEIADEIERLAPAFTGLTAAVLADRPNRDGVVLPLGLETRAGPHIDASADPSLDARPRPRRDPGRGPLRRRPTAEPETGAGDETTSERPAIAHVDTGAASRAPGAQGRRLQPPGRSRPQALRRRRTVTRSPSLAPLAARRRCGSTRPTSSASA